MTDISINEYAQEVALLDTDDESAGCTDIYMGPTSQVFYTSYSRWFRSKAIGIVALAAVCQAWLVWCVYGDGQVCPPVAGQPATGCDGLQTATGYNYHYLSIPSYFVFGPIMIDAFMQIMSLKPQGAASDIQKQRAANVFRYVQLWDFFSAACMGAGSIIFAVYLGDRSATWYYWSTMLFLIPLSLNILLHAFRVYYSKSITKAINIGNSRAELSRLTTSGGSSRPAASLE